MNMFNKVNVINFFLQEYYLNSNILKELIEDNAAEEEINEYKDIIAHQKQLIDALFSEEETELQKEAIFIYKDSLA